MKADTSSRSLWRTPGGVIAAVGAVGVIGYAAWISSSYFDPDVDALVSSGGLILLHTLVCILGLTVVLQPGYERVLRWAWLLLSLGALSNVAAEAVWAYYGLVLQVEPFPSPADYFYSLYYPLTLLGLLIFPFVFVTRQERLTFWLDLTIVLVFFGMVLWYYVMDSPVFSPLVSVKRFLAVLYPIADLMVLITIITLIQRDLTRLARMVLGLMALAMLALIVPDSIFAYYEASDLHPDLAFPTVLWMSAALIQMFATARLIASGPGMLNDPPARYSPVRELLRPTLPYLAIIFGLGLLALIIYTDPGRGGRLMGFLIGAYLLVGFVLLRQYVVLKENVRLVQTMQRIAWTDSLTGVYNRHFFNEMLPREMERANRYQHQLSILLLDIDGFKRYNDTYGHLHGDVVLKTIARTFASQMRASDIIARFGGDEFVVILPETNRRKALTIADRIRGALAAQSFNGSRLSVSIGVTSNRPGMTPEQLLEEADQDMYRRKNIGKTQEIQE